MCCCQGLCVTNLLRHELRSSLKFKDRWYKSVAQQCKRRQKHITSDETFRSGTMAQIFLDCLLQTFGPPRCRDDAERVHRIGLYMLPVPI